MAPIDSTTLTELRPESRRFLVAAVGAGPALDRILNMAESGALSTYFPGVSLAGLALVKDAERAERAKALSVPLYPDLAALRTALPEVNAVMDLSDDGGLMPLLRKELPETVSVVDRLTALFCFDCLDSEALCAGCRGELAYARQLFTTIIDELEEDLFLLDLDGRVVDTNKNVYARQGMTKEELLGRACWEIEGRGFCCDPTHGGCPFKKTRREGVKAESVHSAVDEQGRMRYYRIYTYPVFDNGELTNILEMRRDITARTNMEQRLQKSEKLAAIGELSTYIAHEIRNPLFAIGGFANSLMRSEDLSDQDREKAGIILEESKRLDKILKSILNFARPTEAKEGVVDVNQVAEQTMELMGIGCQRRGIEPLTRLEGDIPLAKGDPELIKQCLINLVKNAMEAMGDETDAGAAAGSRITVRTGLATGGMVALAVEDNGPGIPDEVRDKLFNPFFSTKDKGSGLGLAMTKKIIEEMGGSVELESQVGKGATVILRLLPVLAT